MERLTALNADPYLQLADSTLGILSVFDELRYDRADGDFLSPAMRSHTVRKLEPYGFRQVSGTVIANAELGARVLIPKFHALGASPFDATRYLARDPQDIYLLTPTQTACAFIDRYETEEAVDRIKTLITKQPINVLRIFDFLEDKPAHDAFREAIGHLKLVQREAIAAEPLCRRRGLG
jgi:hypothetical protein